MWEVAFTAHFVRSLNKLPPPLQDEVIEKIKLLKNPVHHQRLRLHKLHGVMKHYHSFSVNYRVRVIIQIIKKQAIALLIDVGDHSLYK